MHSSNRINAETLKTLLPEYLHAVGYTPKITANGSRLSARCPLHADTKPSFTATLKGDAWLWYCHPCGVGGAIAELHAARTGLATKGNFATICREVAELVGLDSTTAPAAPMRATPRPVKVKVSKAINADVMERKTTPWRLRLFDDTALRELFANDLSLSPDTLRKLTMPSLDAFGITPAGLKVRNADGILRTLHKQRLVYIGDGGFKIRDPFGTGKPRFWRVGELRRPWRSHWLTRAPTISDVHLVESESTAAALIEAGYEDPFGLRSCVVATSGANGFEPSWLPMFKGRVVHFWADADDAGTRFFQDTAALLHGTASRIYTHQFNSPALSA
jgi:hypothetical protein